MKIFLNWTIFEQFCEVYFHGLIFLLINFSLYIFRYDQHSHVLLKSNVISIGNYNTPIIKEDFYQLWPGATKGRSDLAWKKKIEYNWILNKVSDQHWP